MHEGLGRNHPMVVFDEHRFCAGQSLEVRCMPRPHMHSQVEINLVLQGAMTYWFDGQRLPLAAGRLVMFWGMMPHQVTAVERATRFVCLYVPLAILLAQPGLARLRDALFRGAMVEALTLRGYDREQFLAWRQELLTGSASLADLVRDEMMARLRRIDREGWQDLRLSAPARGSGAAADAARLLPVEKMTRHIAEQGCRPLTTEEVAEASGLHPNYAMHLFKRAVGVSIKQSINRHRLDAARVMLISSDRPIASIAFDCGFGSLSSFYAAFEKRFTISPAGFRRAFAAAA